MRCSREKGEDFLRVANFNYMQRYMNKNKIDNNKIVTFAVNSHLEFKILEEEKADTKAGLLCLFLTKTC